MRMNKIRLVSIFVCLLFLIIIGASYYRKNEFVRLSKCIVYEKTDDEVILKQLLGTFDTAEYGTKVYLVASPSVWNEMTAMAQDKKIDIDGYIQLSFLYNELFDVKKREEGVYFNIKKIVDIEESNYIPLS